MLVVVEGAIRKWLLPELNEFVYFAKDGVLGIAYILALLHPDRLHHGDRFKMLFPFVFLAASLLVAGVFNPSLGSVIVGAFGAKAYLWYIPLIWIVPSTFNSTTELQKWFRNYLLLVIPVCLLGTAQFAAPPDSVLNRYSNTSDEQAVATFGEDTKVARITGTFSYISGHTSYITAMAIFLLALMVQPAGGWWFLAGMLEFMLIVGNALMSGSRAGVLIVAAAAVVFLLSTAGQDAPALRRFRWLVIGMMVLGCGAALYGFQDALSAFAHRVETAEDTEERMAFVSIERLDEAMNAAGLLGYGTGATHPGGFALRRAFNLGPAFDDPPPAELEYHRVMLELGPIGFLFWNVLRIFLLFALFATWRRMRISFLRQMAFAAFFLHVVNLNGAIVLNHTMGVYYWFSASFIFLLPKLEALDFARVRLASQIPGFRPPQVMPARRKLTVPQ